MQTSSSTQHQSRITAGGRSATNNYSLNKSASASSMKNNADDVLKDLETGLKKSQNYIEESHRLVANNDHTIGWQNLNPLSHNNGTLAPQARQVRASGNILNYLLSC